MQPTLSSSRRNNRSREGTLLCSISYTHLRLPTSMPPKKKMINKAAKNSTTPKAQPSFDVSMEKLLLEAEKSMLEAPYSMLKPTSGTSSAAMVRNAWGQKSTNTTSVSSRTK